MGEDKGQENREYQGGAADAGPRIVTDGKSRPEQGMRDPYLGREAKDERTQTGGRQACVAENDAALGMVGCKSRYKAQERRDEEQKSIDIDRTPGVAGDFKVEPRRCVGEQINEDTTDDAVPMERPGIFHSYRIRKDGPIGIHLQFVMQTEGDEEHRPAYSCGNREDAQQRSISTPNNTALGCVPRGGSCRGLTYEM